MKKLILMPLLILFTIGVILTGHSNKPAQAATKVIELKFNIWGTKGIGVGKVNDAVAELVGERTNGRVKVTPYYNMSLMSFPDTYKGLSRGVADISVYAIDSNPGVHVLNRVYNMPFTSEVPDIKERTEIYRELLAKFPELQQENEKKGTRWLDIHSQASYHMHTVKKEIRVPKDLKGFKMDVGGNHSGLIALVKEAGASVIPAGPRDWYSNLEKGLIEGSMFHMAAVKAFKILDLTKVHTNIGEGGLAAGVFGYMINLKTWNSLPADIQKTMTECFQWACDERVKVTLQDIEDGFKIARENNHKIIDITTDEQQEWYDMAKPIVEKWVNDTEAKGMPARKIYDEFLRLSKEYL